MILLNKKAIEVLGYNISSKELNFVNINKQLIFRDNKIIENTTSCGFLFNKNYFFFGDELSFETKYWDLKNNDLVNIGYLSLNFDMCISGSTLLGIEYQDLQTFKKNLISYNLFTKSKKIIKTNISFGLKLLHDGCIIISEGWNTLKSLSIETGEYLWEVSLENYGYQDAHLGKVEAKIRQVLGISNGVLVVFLFSGALVGISIDTGKILWDIPPKGYYPTGFTGMAWCWHLEDGYLYLLRHQYYLRINLSNQQLEVLWQTSPETLEFEDCSYTEDHIYFMGIDKKLNIFNTSILGVFDRKALKIVWQHDQPIYSAQPPQSDGNKLYCLDTGGTLHIFEKTE